MSNANKMKELAGIFGLELGEEFTINGSRSEYYPYVFTEYGLVDKNGGGVPIPTKLLRGVYTVEKLPFRPEDGQRYYTCDPYLTVLSFAWTGRNYDLERQLLGVVFRTEQEAIKYLPIYKKRLKGEEV